MGVNHRVIKISNVTKLLQGRYSLGGYPNPMANTIKFEEFMRAIFS